MSELIEILKSKSTDELVDELVMLLKNFTVVHDYFDLKYKSKTKPLILNKYKHKIDKAIYPDWEFNEGLNIDLVEEIIEIFSNVTPKINYQIELELYALEAGNKFANETGGDFGENYYMYFEELFEQTLNKLNKTKMSTQLLNKIDLTIKVAFEGYGHKDTLEDLWAEYKENKKEY
ncbi:MAG: hypothetical protein U9Q83_03225 [Bacteroidota bacterium]|nr:hypothetical protein [Bacteroidota bacterium]